MARFLDREGKARELPKYRSHKEVYALEIHRASRNEIDGSVKLEFTDDEFAPLTVEKAVCARYMPIVGDYLVVYADGYRSISPRQAFIDGYQLLQ